MSKQRIIATASFIISGIALIMLVVAVGFIGLDTMAEPSRFIDLALQNPTPIIIQDY